MPCERIFTMGIVKTPSTPHIYFMTYLLSKFQLYNTMPTIVTVLCISSTDLIHFLLISPNFPFNHFSNLCFYQLVLIFSFIRFALFQSCLLFYHKLFFFKNLSLIFATCAFGLLFFYSFYLLKLLIQFSNLCICPFVQQNNILKTTKPTTFIHL